MNCPVSPKDVNGSIHRDGNGKYLQFNARPSLFCLIFFPTKLMQFLACPSNFYSEDEDPEYKPLRMPFKDDMDDFTNSPLDEKEDAAECESEGTL